MNGAQLPMAHGLSSGLMSGLTALTGWSFTGVQRWKCAIYRMDIKAFEMMDFRVEILECLSCMGAGCCLASG
jgi:hypothetical protein